MRRCLHTLHSLIYFNQKLQDISIFFHRFLTWDLLFFVVVVSVISVIMMCITSWDFLFSFWQFYFVTLECGPNDENQGASLAQNIHSKFILKTILFIFICFEKKTQKFTKFTRIHASNWWTFLNWMNLYVF